MVTNLKVIAFIIITFLAFNCYAAPSNTISVPNSFSAGTTIESSKVNANNNEIQNKYNAHTHSDITSLGVITSGTWAGTPISTQYGGTGQDFSSTASGGILFTSATGTIGVLPKANTTGYVLGTKSGAVAPEWVASGAGAKDAITRGFEIIVEQAQAVRCIVNSGTLYHGNTSIDKSTGTILTLATAADWSSGSTVAITSGWNYIGVDSSGNIKFLGALFPDRTTSVDTNPDTPGPKYYSYDGTNYWRVIGAIREDAGSKIPVVTYQRGNRVTYNDPYSNANLKVLNAGAQTTFTAVDCSSAVPKISTLCDINYSNSNTLDMNIRTTGSNATNGWFFSTSSANQAKLIASIQLNDSQSYDYKVTANNTTHYVTAYILDIR